MTGTFSVSAAQVIRGVVQREGLPARGGSREAGRFVGAFALLALASCSQPASEPDRSMIPAPRSSAPGSDLAVFERVRMLKRAGRFHEGETTLRTLAGDERELWKIRAPNNDMSAFYDAGRELVELLVAQGKADEAARYLATLDPSTGEGPDYDFELAQARVLQAQSRPADAERIYQRLQAGFPAGGYGTFGEWFFMWEAEIEIGLAETLIARGEIDEARVRLGIWNNQDLGKLERRWAEASVALGTPAQALGQS